MSDVFFCVFFFLNLPSPSQLELLFSDASHPGPVRTGPGGPVRPGPGGPVRPGPGGPVRPGGAGAGGAGPHLKDGDVVLPVDLVGGRVEPAALPHVLVENAAALHVAQAELTQVQLREPGWRRRRWRRARVLRLISR